MQVELLEILRCPISGEKLEARDTIVECGRIRSGQLVTSSGRLTYPVREFIPRFVPTSNYADNFGMQWNKFRRTQLDSYSGQPISAERFWKATGWDRAQMRNRWVLDVGCGSGRFAEVALLSGAKVVALDYSSAVDACYENLKGNPNLHVVQGDIFALPFAKEAFAFVYSLGVLQHTPNVAKAFASLPPLVAKKGKLCTDVYWKRLPTLMHAKYAVRPITKRIPQDKLFGFLEHWVPAMLRASMIIGKIPLAGRFLKRLIPVADYSGIYNLDHQQLCEWALLDTFDMLAPKYDSPQTPSTMQAWMCSCGMEQVEILHASLLVARGVKT
jgi:SAM-dependent methyltransferase